MKKTIAIITLISAVIGSSLSAQSLYQSIRKSPADVADRLIEIYDWNASGALDELELSNAVDYLELSRPFYVWSDPDLSQKRERPSSPKIAVNMRKIFDLDQDYQLCEDELAVAIAGLRTRVLTSNSPLAMAE